MEDGLCQHPARCATIERISVQPSQTELVLALYSRTALQTNRQSVTASMTANPPSTTSELVSTCWQWTMLTVLGSIFVLLARVVIVDARMKAAMPPGPPGLPIFGNIFQISRFPWLRFTTWGRRYGESITPYSAIVFYLP